MVPGEAKARAIASVKAYIATLPPLEIGRDEGLVAMKEEARGGGGGGGKRSREKDRAEGQGREKKPKAVKSSREEKQREEDDRKQRLSEVGILRV